MLRQTAANTRTDLWALLAGLASAFWIPAGLVVKDAPAWPSVSLGLVALYLARKPGGALARGLAAFAGLCGILVGGAQIAGLWVFSQLL